jgi:hypothetical protein
LLCGGAASGQARDTSREQPEQLIMVTGPGSSPPAGEEVFDDRDLDRERLTGSASNRLEDILRDIPGFQLFRRSDCPTRQPDQPGRDPSSARRQCVERGACCCSTEFRRPIRSADG